VRHTLAVCFVISGAVALTAHAEPAVDEPAVRGLLDRASFAPAQAQAALALLDRADRRGLPTEALVNRIREGVARRAQPRVILGVVEDRVTQLERADEVIRASAEKGVVVHDRERSLMRIADALAQGVTPGDVRDLIPAAAEAGADLPRLARAAEVLGHLARKGFAPADTREAVAVAVAQGWPTERMDDLVGLFLKADAERLSGGEAREAVLERLRDERSGPRGEAEIRRNAEGTPGSGAQAASKPRGKRERE
jgi:hypothetical protein